MTVERRLLDRSVRVPPAVSGGNWLLRRIDQRAIDDGRLAFVIEKRNQRFADAELGDHGFDVEIFVLAKRLRRGLHRLLIARRERAQRVLHAIAELAENDIRERRADSA